MAKYVTPTMERLARKQARSKGKKSTPLGDVWRRLKRDKRAMVGLVIFALLVIVALFPGVLTRYDFATQDYRALHQLPSGAHWFGTDHLGRDIYTRVIYGTRVSLGIGMASVAVALIVGGTLGAVSAFYSNRVDNVIMRIMDIFGAIPGTLLAISIAAVLGRGVANLILALGVSAVPMFARIVRANVLTVKSKDYVEAGKCVGASDMRLILKHMIPNAMGPIIVQATFGVASNILMIAGLSYIGLGIAPPTPEWGGMLSDAKTYIQQFWHPMVFPGIAIFLTSFSLNVLGDGLRDAFDPKLR